MEVTQATVDFIKSWEGCRLEAYQDQGGRWTIGYGYAGSDINEDTVWSQDQADQNLTQRLVGVARWCSDLIKVPTTSNQNTALISMCDNIGYGDFKKSALLRLLNSGNYQEAADQFLSWNKIHGYINNGLTRRRNAERTLFLT